MLSYRAATLLIRTHAPEVMNGMHVVEEIEDISLSRDVTPKAQTLSARLDDLIANSEEDVVNIKEVSTPECTKLAELVLTHNIPAETVEKWCQKAGVSRLDELDKHKAQSCIDYIIKRDDTELE